MIFYRKILKASMAFSCFLILISCSSNPSKSSYGCVEGDCKNGYGVYKDSDTWGGRFPRFLVSTYEGGFLNGKKHGAGQITCAASVKTCLVDKWYYPIHLDGIGRYRLVGTWKEGEMHGVFEEFYKTNENRKKGVEKYTDVGKHIFVNGKQRKTKIDSKTLAKIKRLRSANASDFDKSLASAVDFFERNKKPIGVVVGKVASLAASNSPTRVGDTNTKWTLIKAKQKVFGDAGEKIYHIKCLPTGELTTVNFSIHSPTGKTNYSAGFASLNDNLDSAAKEACRIS